MDLFLTKDEKLENLEKKIRHLENRIDKNFQRTEESFETFKKIIIGLQNENKELKKDNAFLIEKYKEVLRKTGTNAVMPLKKSFDENVNLVKDLILEDIGIEDKNIDDFFELIMKEKRISLNSAARRLDVSNKKAKYWALKLKNENLINIEKKLNVAYLKKINK